MSKFYTRKPIITFVVENWNLKRPVTFENPVYTKGPCWFRIRRKPRDEHSLGFISISGLYVWV